MATWLALWLVSGDIFGGGGRGDGDGLYRVDDDSNFDIFSNPHPPPIHNFLTLTTAATFIVGSGAAMLTAKCTGLALSSHFILVIDPVSLTYTLVVRLCLCPPHPSQPNNAPTLHRYHWSGGGVQCFWGGKVGEWSVLMGSAPFPLLFCNS